MVKLKIKIKENSPLARLAAKKLKTKNMAMTLGRTIHLYNADRSQLTNNKRWLRHELKHVEQFGRYGFFLFLILYTYESLRKGYHNNRFEVEARNAEDDEHPLEKWID